MNLNEQWKQLTDAKRTQEENDSFWTNYLEQEKLVYEDILQNNKKLISGKTEEIAKAFNLDPATFAGFIGGINTSLAEQIDMETLTEDQEIKLDIDYEKLYWNMLDAKAEWLYNLPQWDDILSQEKRDEIAKEYNRSKIAVSIKVGRNDPCICGSGKKFKKCCG